MALVIIVNLSPRAGAEEEPKTATTGKILFELRPASDSPKKGYLLKELPNKQGPAYISGNRDETVKFFAEDIASVQFVSVQTKSVFVNFTASGTRKMENITEAMIGHRLAIIVDGKPITAPVVREKVRRGVLITCSDNSEAELIASVISGGKPVTTAEPQKPGEDHVKWPRAIREAFWIYEKNEDIKYSFKGYYEVTYTAHMCRPAAPIISEMVKSMTVKGWERVP